MRAAIFCLLLSAVAISADLQSDIDDIGRHLPMEQIEQIGQKYVATYPGIRSALEYLQTVGEEKILSDLAKSKHIIALLKYFKRNGIDGEALGRHLVQKTLAFHRKLLEQHSSGEVQPNLPAISGDFMRDVLAVIRKSDILQAIEEKEKTSPEYAKFLAAIRTPEFKTLFFKGVNARAVAVKRAHNSKRRGSFQDALQRISAVGFDTTVEIY